jgi:hypothetical protein
MPFPWDLTEKGMILVVLLFTLLIASLELIKIIWTGKVNFLKRDIDFVLFALLLGLIFTTIFANDTNLSLFGYDYQFSSGLIGFTALFLLTFLVRTFISTKKDILNLLNSFFIGSILTSFLSLISLFGGNIFNVIPKIGVIGVEGLPTLGAPSTLVVFNCIAILLGYIALELYKTNEEKNDASWFVIVTIIVNIISLVLFSINSKAFLVSIVFTILWNLLLISLFLKNKKKPLKKKIRDMIFPLSILILIVLIQIDSVQKLIVDNRILSPLGLSIDLSWRIVSQSLMNSIKNGILGNGLDSFRVIFTTLRPSELLNVNLGTAYNEILTFISTAGFLWLVIWFLLGWYLIKQLISDIKDYKVDYKTLVFFDFLLLFIYIYSFLGNYTVILRFLFLSIISLRMILRSTLKQGAVDNLILKIWTIETGKRKEGTLPIMSVFMSIIVVIVMVFGMIRLYTIGVSSLYIMRSESYITTQNEKYGDREPSLEEQEEITDNLYRWYQKALDLNPNNPLNNRKTSLVSVDRLGLLMKKYEETEDEDVLNNAVELRNNAFEYSRKAINLSPSIYTSYNNRVLVYLGIINLGYTEYIRDGISAINEAIEMNPLDYQNYYNRAQLYYLIQNYDLATDSAIQSLEVKSDHIPSLVILANINGSQGEYGRQLSYLQAAKTLLESNDLQESKIYKDLLGQINSVNELIDSLETEEEEDKNEDIELTVENEESSNEPSPETEQ